MKTTGFITTISMIWLLALPTHSSQAALNAAAGSPDRAVEIARQARDRVESSGKGLQASSREVFQAFAERTVNLQKLLDARQQLEESGLLDRKDPDGAARRAHINGKILLEVGELKQTCDKHLNGLLSALDSFDQAVADSLIDSQATRSINSNYELALEEYVKQERAHFRSAAQDAEAALNAYQGAGESRLKERLRKKYLRAKRRLQQMDQRRKLYDARLKVAAMNQKISGLIREKIRQEGHEVPTQFRDLLAGLYNTFAAITPVAEVGGTGSSTLLANAGFGNLGEVRNTLQVAGGAVGKLGNVLNSMVNDVLAGLGDIQVVEGAESTSTVFSADEEMDYLRRLRENWKG